MISEKTIEKTLEKTSSNQIEKEEIEDLRCLSPAQKKVIYKRKELD